MRLRLDTTEALAASVPGLQTEHIRAVGGRKFVARRQRFLADVVGIAYAGRKAHARNSKNFSSAFTFSRDEWVRGLASSPRRYKRLIAPLFDFPEGNRGYSRDHGHTKAYTLKEHVSEAASQVFGGYEPLPVRCGETGEPITLSSLPSNGLPEDAGTPFTVPSILPLSVGDVDRALGILERWKRIHGYGWAPLDLKKPNKDTLDGALRYLRVCRQWSVSLGGIPNFYRLQSQGRVGPSEGIAPHIITTPAMIRRLLLSSSGLVYYDLRACFWSVFCSLGRAMDFSTRYAEGYLENRPDWHSRFRAITGCRDYGSIKAVLLSWLSGAQLSANPRTNAFELLGAAGADALVSDNIARQLYQEVRAGLKVVLQRAPRVLVESHAVPINAIGIPLRPTKGRPKFAQEAAHLLTGYEQFAIRAMCSRLVGLRAIIYDGFIAPPQDPEALEDHVRRESEDKLGISLRVSLKAVPFSEPEDPTEEDVDF